jgi:NAD(P) transhydrogenase subunit beta
MNTIVHLSYLVSISLFMLGLKFLGSPRTARRGNFLSMLGMFVAVVVTLLDRKIVDFRYIIAGIIIGGTVGAFWARKVRMTAMPQMVAVFNSFGGGASALVVMVQFLSHSGLTNVTFQTTVCLSLFIGTITFTGSLCAFLKLEGWIKSAPVVFPAQKVLNVLLLLIVFTVSMIYVLEPASDGTSLLIAVLTVSSLLGITLVIPIGGADMPVVIALLNSFSGLAASASGFVISNSVLIVSGALVGASGIILTRMMSQAMNRSLANILFGAVGLEGHERAPEIERRVTRYSAQDAAAVMENAQSIIIAPGYGLAVAQAQYVLNDTADYLLKKGIHVRYAIHPVAGRMPGHMNVLLAEAHVPYDLLKDINEINEDFQNTDVVLVVGANDVINPAAREKGNALSGMPILNADQAKTIIIIKRSLRPGFAGVDNDLFYDPKTLMVLGDAKEVLTEILSVLKQSDH